MAADPPVVPVEEFQSRIDRLRARMEELRLSHLIVYGGREHFANLASQTSILVLKKRWISLLRGERAVRPWGDVKSRMDRPRLPTRPPSLRQPPLTREDFL